MKGFTLIELLVVVLIIGILASVALPQYEKAVMKARSAEAMTVLKKLGDNMEMHVLSGGTNADFPCETIFDGFPEGEKDCAFSTKNFNFATAYGILLAEEKNGNYGLAFLPPAVEQFGFERAELGRWCVPETDKGTAFCKSLSGGKAPQSLSFAETAYPF